MWIEYKSFDEERALYGARGVNVRNCLFAGPKDGESAFKECRNVRVEDTLFELRYPFWHDDNLSLKNVTLTDKSRAALWYTRHVTIEDSRLHGIKALRECHDITMKNTDIISPEFGWNSGDITMENVQAESEYFLMRADHIRLDNATLTGKYSFQYVEEGTVTNSHFDTKDAFWHSKNVTIKDSVIKGEYFAWYSENLTLVNCKIIGTQPLCYAKKLTMIDCVMVDADFAFEKSTVDVTLTAPIDSIRVPSAGTIRVPAVGEIIRDDAEAEGEIILTAMPKTESCRCHKQV